MLRKEGGRLSTGRIWLRRGTSDRSCVRGPFEKYVDWQQGAAVMQREEVTVMLSFNGVSNVVVA
jgi:hypothetical protein